MGAGTNVFCLSVYNRPDPLQIWQPASASMVVRVTYVATGGWAFTTYFTYLRHSQGPLFLKIYVGQKSGGYITRQNDCRKVYHRDSMKKRNSPGEHRQISRISAVI